MYLDDFRVEAEMTATYWTGIYRFTFPKSEQSHILMDLGFEGGDIEISDDHTVRGCAVRPIRGGVSGTSETRHGADMLRRHVLEGFPVSSGRSRRFSRTRSAADGFLGDNKVTPDGKTESGPYAGVYLNFATSEGEQVLVKTAAADSFEDAQKRLETESPGWNFDGIHRQAEETWAKLLNTIEVKGGTDHERMLFYSNLFHSFASPRLVARKGEPFRGLDGKMKTADYDRYGPVPFWDTGPRPDRVAHPGGAFREGGYPALDAGAGPRDRLHADLVSRRSRRVDVPGRLAAGRSVRLQGGVRISL